MPGRCCFFAGMPDKSAPWLCNAQQAALLRQHHWPLCSLTGDAGRFFWGGAGRALSKSGAFSPLSGCLHSREKGGHRSWTLLCALGQRKLSHFSSTAPFRTLIKLGRSLCACDTLTCREACCRIAESQPVQQRGVCCLPAVASECCVPSRQVLELPVRSSSVKSPVLLLPLTAWQCPFAGLALCSGPLFLELVLSS